MAKKTVNENLISRLAHAVFMAPRYRRGLACAVENYCSRDCKRRVSGVNGYDCLREVCRRRLHYYENDEMPIAYCVGKKCKYLLKSGISFLCIKSRKELQSSRTPYPPSGHTTLRLRWKAGGWTYRRV